MRGFKIFLIITITCLLVFLVSDCTLNSEATNYEATSTTKKDDTETLELNFLSVEAGVKGQYSKPTVLYLFSYMNGTSEVFKCISSDDVIGFYRDATDKNYVIVNLANPYSIYDRYEFHVTPDWKNE